MLGLHLLVVEDRTEAEVTYWGTSRSEWKSEDASTGRDWAAAAEQHQRDGGGDAGPEQDDAQAVASADWKF